MAQRQEESVREVRIPRMCTSAHCFQLSSDSLSTETKYFICSAITSRQFRKLAGSLVRQSRKNLPVRVFATELTIKLG